MAHNRMSQYSAPFRRNNLLNLPQYTASDGFPTLGKWDRARSDDLYVVKGTQGRTQPVGMVIVGAISSDKASLQPHGNYDPSYMPEDQIGKKAKLQFVITSPEAEPDFLGDYSIGLDRLKAIQKEVAGSPNKQEHFIEGNNMKMNFYLFEEKIPDDSDSESDENQEGSDNGRSDRPAHDSEPPVYHVASQYMNAWENVSITHHNNIMEVYGTNEMPIDYRNFEKFLKAGAVVAVTFTLKHWAIREKGTTEIASDTYCANIQSVSILKEAIKPPRRLLNTTKPTRRPNPVPQLPSRGTLQYAADTFAPVNRHPIPDKVHPIPGKLVPVAAGSAKMSTRKIPDLPKISKPMKPTGKGKQKITPSALALRSSPASSTTEPSTSPTSSSYNASGSSSSTSTAPRTRTSHQDILDQVLPYILEHIKRARSPSPVVPERLPSLSFDSEGELSDLSDIDIDTPEMEQNDDNATSSSQKHTEVCETTPKEAQDIEGISSRVEIASENTDIASDRINDVNVAMFPSKVSSTRPELHQSPPIPANTISNDIGSDMSLGLGLEGDNSDLIPKAGRTAKAPSRNKREIKRRRQ